MNIVHCETSDIAAEKAAWVGINRRTCNIRTKIPPHFKMLITFNYRQFCHKSLFISFFHSQAQKRTKTRYLFFCCDINCQTIRNEQEIRKQYSGFIYPFVDTAACVPLISHGRLSCHRNSTDYRYSRWYSTQQWRLTFALTDGISIGERC